MRSVLVIGWVLGTGCWVLGSGGQGHGAAGGVLGTGYCGLGGGRALALADPVPAGHWAHAAIAQLQATNTLIGYPKAYFSSPNLRSRYELAAAIHRCVMAILPSVPPHGAMPLEAPGPYYSISAEDLGLVRKLSLEFKPELIALGFDWKAADGHLHTLQDKKLHTDVAEALAAVAPKPTDAAGAPAASAPKQPDERSMFEDVNRPSWVYDALKQLSPKESPINKPYARRLTRYEAAVCVKRCCDAFSETEDSQSNVPSYIKAASTFDLKDVVELHKLVRTFIVELPQLGMDVKAAEVMLSKAEVKRIQALETISVRR